MKYYTNTINVSMTILVTVKITLRYSFPKKEFVLLEILSDIHFNIIILFIMKSLSDNANIIYEY